MNVTLRATFPLLLCPFKECNNIPLTNRKVFIQSSRVTHYICFMLVYKCAHSLCLFIPRSKSSFASCVAKPDKQK